MICLKKFFAGVIDRIMIAIMFFIITMAYFGIYGSSGYMGSYSVIAVETHPSNYAYMPPINHNSSSYGVSDGYNKLKALEQADKGLDTYYELDSYMTTIFILTNILHLLLAGAIFKSTIGERICRLKTVDNEGDLLDVVSFIKKSVILGVVLYVFVQIRDIVDTTYLSVSILFFIINWGLIIYKKKSLVDLLSKSNVIGKNETIESMVYDYEDSTENGNSNKRKSYIITAIIIFIGLIAWIGYNLSKDNYNVQSYEDIEQQSEAKQAETEESFVHINKEYGEDVYDVVEEMPSFPGGMQALMQYLNSNISYPVIAEENGIQGRVICSFIVGEDGHIDNIRIEKSIEPSLDKEAIRVIKSMPNWEPGKQNGCPVRVKYTLPVTFRLE